MIICKHLINQKMMDEDSYYRNDSFVLCKECYTLGKHKELIDKELFEALTVLTALNIKQDLNKI